MAEWWACAHIPLTMMYTRAGSWPVFCRANLEALKV